MIVKYISFNSSEEFEKWQEDNPDNEVVQITPLISGIDFKINDEEKIFGGDTKLRVFVIYRNNVARRPVHM